MSFCIRPSVCKKCGKPLTLFEGWHCLECEKAEQEPKITTTSTDEPMVIYYPQVEGITPTVVKAEQEPCTDAVSRRAVLDVVYESRKNFNNEFDQGFFADKIRDLPSVRPQEPCDIEAIRAAIEFERDGKLGGEAFEAVQYRSFNKALEIIDKYTMGGR